MIQVRYEVWKSLDKGETWFRLWDNFPFNGDQATEKMYEEHEKDPECFLKMVKATYEDMLEFGFQE